MTSRINRFRLGLVLAAILLLCSGPALARPHTPAFDRTLRGELTDYLTGLIDYFRIPGAVMAIKDPSGAVARFAAGTADYADGRAMSTDLHLHIGSLTKSFVAETILQLVDEGRLTLDDVVDRRLTPGLVENGDRITIAQLLEMRSGLGHYDHNLAFMALVEADPTRDWTPEQLIGYSAGILFEPGAAYDYNNINYIILGLIIETIDGRTWEEAVQARILTPLGLTETSAPTTPALPQPFARGYQYQNGQVVDYSTYFTTTIFGAAGSIVSTVDDLLAWIDEMLTGRLISPAMQLRRLTFYPIPSHPGAGYGFALASVGGSIGHNGSYSGIYTATAYRYRGYDIAILCNGQAAGGGDASKADNVYAGVEKVIDQHLAR